MLHFRPLPILTAVCTVVFAILISLGVWQIQRLHWKLGLIAEVNHSLALPPVSLDEALAMGAAAVPPWPPCSTKAQMAMRGLSAGA